MELLLVFIVTVALLYVNDDMAYKRGRNRVIWFLFGLIVSPLLSMFLLWCLGEKNENPSTGM
ncbi:MAG: hypothetical protein ACRCWQ_02210 [Bacilli bacterium]